MDTFIHYGLAAAIQALAATPASTAIAPEPPSASACNVGSGIGGLPLIEDTHDELIAKRPAARSRRSSSPAPSST